MCTQDEAEKECPLCGAVWYSGGTQTGVTIVEICPTCRKKEDGNTPSILTYRCGVLKTSL